MAESDIARTLVDILNEDGLNKDGKSGMRPVHAWGIGATGSFLPSDVAGNFCIAEHFRARFEPGSPHRQVPVPVTVRFSNGSGTHRNDGTAGPHDGWSDVRGMATRFHLADEQATDLIGMTLPCFFTTNPEEFKDFAIAAKPAEFKRESPWQKILDLLRLTLPLRDPNPGETYRPDEGAMRYADEHSFARLPVFQAASIGAPASYVRATYHAVHAFIVTAPDGTRRWVRFTWQPIAGALNISPFDDDYHKHLTTPYLQQELRDRLADKKTARFSLMMVIGELGDDFNDPTVPWPPHRIRIEMGTLTLDKVADVEKLSFNPGLLTDGIEPSDDEVLWVRQKAYIDSSKWRHGEPCPFKRT